MSNYSKITDYAAKDLLLHGDAAKAIKGTEVGAEFDAIATMSATKVDSGGALGTPTSGTLTNCTGLPLAGVVDSTTEALGVGSIELGHATDTTITRTGAGAIAVEGVAVLLTNSALGTPASGTLTNCTGLPLSGVVDSTTEALGVGSLELGHATDTTITRVSAGTIAVEGVNVLTTTTGAALSGATFTGAVNGTNFPLVNEFRLTLTTGVPVTTSDVTGATTIYCTPYKGNRIALYTGAAWVTRTSAEFSLALGTLTASLPYDVFCYDNSGTPTLEFLAWTNTTTRATALTYQDGILVKTGATTRRYLGTFYTDSTTQTSDAEATRHLWNYYHRTRRSLLKGDATASWTYTTATFRQANNSTANQVSFVIGVAEDAVVASVSACASNTTGGAGTWATSGIGLDSTSVNSGTGVRSGIAVNSGYVESISNYAGIPGVGRHFIAWLEFSAATGTQTWYGTAGEILTGIRGGMMA